MKRNYFTIMVVITGILMFSLTLPAYAEPQPQDVDVPAVEETQPKQWAITMDLGFYDEDAEGSYLGTALARMLLQTWRRQERLTSLKLDAAEEPDED